jgi:biotin carboxylase
MVVRLEDTVTREQRPSILMLGTDRYPMRACVKLGIDAVVVCGPSGRDNGFVPVPEGLRALPVDEQSSVDAIMTALHRAGLDGLRFTGIQTTDEWALVPGSLLALHLGCEFLDPATAVHFRDKSVQKRLVRAAGIKAARVTVIDDIYDVSGIDELPYPQAVLKPVSGAATKHTSVVSNVAELRARGDAYRRARTAERTFVLEEFITGDEWVADGFVFDGELEFCSIGTYADPCLVTVDRDLPLSIRRFDPDHDQAYFERSMPVVRDALRALGLRDGVFHMELFHDPRTGEITFSECAARRGGGLIHEELQAKFGVSLGECAVLCAIGRRPEPPVKVDPRVIGGAYLQGHPGILVRCPTPAELTERPGVLFARVERPYGMHLTGERTGTNDRIGQVLMATGTEEEFSSRLAEVRAWFDERVVVVPEGALNRELRAWQRQTWPDADHSDTFWDPAT